MIKMHVKIKMPVESDWIEITCPKCKSKHRFAREMFYGEIELGEKGINVDCDCGEWITIEPEE